MRTYVQGITGTERVNNIRELHAGFPGDRDLTMRSLSHTGCPIYEYFVKHFEKNQTMKQHHLRNTTTKIWGFEEVTSEEKAI